MSRHKQRLSPAWWLKLVGLAPPVITAIGLLVISAFHGHNHYLRYAAAIAVTGALGYLGWRKPGLFGWLLVAFAPLGAFFSLLAASGVLFIVVFLVLCGIPLVAGLVLIVAARWE